MKLCRDLPETAKRLKSGRLSLSVASQLQVFFEKRDKKVKEEKKKQQLSENSVEERVSVIERKEQESGNKQLLKEKPEEEFLKREATKEHLKTGKDLQSEDLNGNSLYQSFSRKEKESLVKRAEGCSTRAAEKFLSEEDPSLSLSRRERVRFLGKGQVEIKIVIDEKCHKELEKLKNLLSHKNPSLSYGELLSILSKEALKKHDPKEKNTRSKKEEKSLVKKQEFKDHAAEVAVPPAQKRELKVQSSN